MEKANSWLLSNLLALSSNFTCDSTPFPERWDVEFLLPVTQISATMLLTTDSLYRHRRESTLS